MGARVRVQLHAGVEDPVGVEHPLDALHHPVRAVAPLGPHERGHVAARAVLGLDRPVVLVHHEVHEPLDESAVALDRLGAAHVLGHHEVQVPVLRVAEDHGVRHAVALEERLAVEDGLGEPGDGHRHVLGEEGRPGRAHGAGAGGEALAHVPQRRPLRLAGREPRGLEEPVAREDRLGVAGRRGERRRVHPTELDEERRVSPLDLEGQRVLRRDGAQRSGVEDLERVRSRRGERRHRGPRLLEVGEVDEGRRARGRLGDGAEGRLPHEAERPLRADHEVGEDVRGPVEVHERVEAVAARVLRPELVTDAGGEGQRRGGSRRAGPKARRAAPAAPAGARRRRRAARCRPRRRRRGERGASRACGSCSARRRSTSRRSCWRGCRRPWRRRSRRGRGRGGSCGRRGGGSGGRRSPPAATRPAPRRRAPAPRGRTGRSRRGRRRSPPAPRARCPRPGTSGGGRGEWPRRADRGSRRCCAAGRSPPGSAGRSTRRRSGRGGRSDARGRGRARGSARGRPRLRGRQVSWCLR